MAELPSSEEVKGLISLLAPGLVIMSIRGRVLSGAVPELKERIVTYAAISAAYYAVATPLFHVPWGCALPPLLIDFLEYVGAPALIGLALAYITQYGIEYSIAEKLKLNFAHHIPAAWDFTFNKLTEGTFVLVTLTDGSTVAGLMGARSFASSSREERDLLLEEVWEAKNTGWERKMPPRSILLCGRDVRYVEMF